MGSEGKFDDILTTVEGRTILRLVFERNRALDRLRLCQLAAKELIENADVCGLDEHYGPSQMRVSVESYKKLIDAIHPGGFEAAYQESINAATPDFETPQSRPAAPEVGGQGA